MGQPVCDVSVVIVSFNTCGLLRECLQSLSRETRGLSAEVLVVDNASHDESAEMVAREFPDVRLIRSDTNLGFAAANNRAFEVARGRYVVLLNSDAFVSPDALTRAVILMDAHPRAGLGGARLIGRDGAWQPAARQFPSLLNKWLTLTGLAARYPRSKFFGRVDRTWADADREAEVDWVPGAFSIIRREALDAVGWFDEAFFLYYEEVDLCRRLKAAGYSIHYWPDLRIIHLGGESSKTVRRLHMSSSGSQLALWRMRSELLYHRKHQGWLGALLVAALEIAWHRLRAARHQLAQMPDQRAKREESYTLVALMQQAWRETAGGRVSPLRPW